MEALAEVNLVMILFTRLEVSVSFRKKAKTNSSSEMTPSLSESISDISLAEIYQILCCKYKIYFFYFSLLSQVYSPSVDETQVQGGRDD